MLLLPVLTGFAVSLAGALLLVPIVRQLAHRIGWVDAPDGERKVHREPVPNVGGLGIIGGVLLGLGALVTLDATGLASLEGVLPSSRWLIGALLIAAVGFIDDRVDLNHWTRLVAQLGVTALVFSDGARITLLDGVLGGGPLALVASFTLTAIWMVGMMNAVNLIDGLDGLAAGTVAIAFVGLTGVHALSGSMPSLLLMMVILGALIGFLRYNCCPASIFMGDSGSLFLGFSLAAYGLYGTAHTDPILNLVIPAVVMGLPVLDTTVSILRRLVTRRPLFAPDKDHIHHRLADQMSPARAVRVLWGLGLFLALGGLAMAALPVWAAALVFLVGSGVVYDLLWRVGYLPSPASIALRIRRRRRLEEVRSERMHRTTAASAPDLPPRAGRVSDERYHPISGPER
ncbi:MAG: MraY family glycosyltransferase [Rubricoccaceae bacterium]